MRALLAASPVARVTGPDAFTVADAERTATELHAGQVDKAGEPYVGHLARTAAGAVSAAPADLRDRAAMAGWLHDSIEDTATTADDLLSLGVPADVVEAVVLLTKTAGVDTREYLTRIEGNPLALLVKRADMNDNADEARLGALPEPLAARLRHKYAGYRAILADLAGAPGTE